MARAGSSPDGPPRMRPPAASAAATALGETVRLREQEWREALQQHTSALEEQLAAKARALVQLERRFKDLKDDFKYNLQLLHERDAELEQLEGTYDTFRQALRSREEDMSELKVQAAAAAQAAELERSKTAQLTHHYQRKLQELEQAHAADLRRRDAELQELRSKHASDKLDWQHAAADLREQLAQKQTQLAAEFDSAAMAATADLRSRLAEAEAMVVQRDTELRAAQRQAELARAKAAALQADNTALADARLAAEKKQKEAEWQLEGLRNARDDR